MPAPDDEPLGSLARLSDDELELAELLVRGVAAAENLRVAATRGKIDAGTLDLEHIGAEARAELELLLAVPEGERPH